MIVDVNIPPYLVLRGADVPDSFFTTNNPIALAMRPVFKGMNCSINDPVSPQNNSGCQCVFVGQVLSSQSVFQEGSNAQRLVVSLLHLLLVHVC